jgi:hypothetical protein
MVRDRGAAGKPSPASALVTHPAGVPRPLDVEIPRLRLVQRLENRWDRSVTLVVAGPGFGKTTVLAQAVRAHQLAPRGIDAWVSCEAAHEDSVRLARALLGALSSGDGHAHGPGRRADPGPRDVVAALDPLVRSVRPAAKLLILNASDRPVDGFQDPRRARQGPGLAVLPRPTRARRRGVGMPRLLSALHPRGASQYVTGPRPEAARVPAAMAPILDWPSWRTGEPYWSFGVQGGGGLGRGGPGGGAERAGGGDA